MAAMGMDGHSLAEYKSSGHNRDSSVLSGSFPHPHPHPGAGPGYLEEDRAPLVSGARFDGPGHNHMRGRSEEMDIGEGGPLHQPPPYASNPALETYSDVPQPPPHLRRMSAYNSPYGYGQPTGYDPTGYR